MSIENKTKAQVEFKDLTEGSKVRDPFKGFSPEVPAQILIMRALAEAKYHGKGNDLKLEVDFSNGEIASMKFTVLGKTELEEAKPAKAEQ